MTPASTPSLPFPAPTSHDPATICNGPRPMNLARVIHLDQSDLEIYDPAAEPGEWVVPGSFAFSNWSEADLTGQARQEFAHGFLGLDSFGRATVVSVTPITEAERDALIDEAYDGPRPHDGVGGTRRGVKCLHAHYAWYLAGGDDPIGRWVEAELRAMDGSAQETVAP